MATAALHLYEIMASSTFTKTTPSTNEIETHWHKYEGGTKSKTLPSIYLSLQMVF